MSDKFLLDTTGRLSSSIKPAISVGLLLLPCLMLFQNCGGFYAHTSKKFSQLDSSSIASGNLTISEGKVLYGEKCAGCHGPIDTSAKQGRTPNMIFQAIANISTMNSQPALVALTPAQVTAIAQALAFGDGLVETPGGRLQFTCTPGTNSPTPALKLTNREFRTAMNALLDDFSTTLKSDFQLATLYSALPSDQLTVDRNTRKEQAQLVTQLSTNAFFEVAFRAGELVATSATGLQNYPGTAGCLAAGTLTQVCHENFVRELGSRAFRKPMTGSAGSSLAASVWDPTLSKAQQIQLTVASITQMPDFQYKVYDAGPAVAGARVLGLTSYEFASKLSFFLTGAPPDSVTRGLASSGEILNPAAMDAELDRLLSRPGARDMVQRLFRESYGYDVYDSLSYSTDFLNGISTTGLATAMNEELDDYFIQAVIDQNGTFSNLMTSRQATINHAGLASIYGVSVGSNQMLPATRTGFLNRASMLTKRSGYRASPIKRGLKVLEHVLCVDVGNPPPNAPTVLPDFSGEILTTREATRRTSEAAGSACVACHSSINNLGYPFESFDTLGRVRTHERIFNGSGVEIASLPVDTQSTTSRVASTRQTVADSAALSGLLGLSDRGMTCMVRHLKRFESRVAETPEDGCQMNESLNALYGANTSQGTIKDAIKRYITSEQFRRWKY